jgi:hypothetical protein
MRLNAQYGSMVRTSLSVHGRLMRVQALRQKREKIDGAANEDAWALHVAEQSMLQVVEPDPGPPQAAWPEVAAAAAPACPKATPVEAPAARVDETVAQTVSEIEPNSHNAAFETWLSEQLWHRGSSGSGGTDLHEVVREPTAQSPLADRKTNSRKRPRRVDHGCHIDGATAST